MGIASGTASRASCAFTVALVAALACGPATAERRLTVRDTATGQTETLTSANASFAISEFGNTLNIAVEAQSPGINAAFAGGNWYLKFEAPPGEKLQPGQYLNAGCPGGLRTGRVPSLEVTDNNPICRVSDAIWGSFVIRQIAYGDDGHVSAIELTFQQRAGSANAAPLVGLLRLDTEPLELELESDPGFFWPALAQKHNGDTGLFALNGTTAGIDYTASVVKDLWSVAIEPPAGMQLKVGRRYNTRNFAGNGHAGLVVLRGVRPQGCGDATGSVLIRKLETTPAGAVTAIHADFEYRCPGSNAALRGTIRHLL